MAKAEAEAAEPGIVNQMVAVDLISPHPGNYNRHDESQISDLRLSLRRFGQVRSVVVQADGAGAFLMVAGEGIWRSAKAEGFAELRADVIPADWTPARVLAYLAADNELARRGLPDEAQLAAIIEQIQREADEELARLAAGGETRLAEIMAGIEGSMTAGPSAAEARATLTERFVVPPFSVLDARQGYWQERKRAWLALGIQSELGRGEANPGGSPRDAASLGPDGRTVRGDGHGKPMIQERERE